MRGPTLLLLALACGACTIRAASPDQRLRTLAAPATDVPADPSPGCTHPQGTGSGKLTMWSGGRERTYLLRLPKAPTRPMPVVLNFHGWTGNSQLEEQYTFMTPAADERGMVVVYPQGIGKSFNAGSCCGRSISEEIDDVQFSRDLIERLGKQLCIDRNRVYATGMSNGGMFSSRLACDASDVFSAVASVAACETAEVCKPAHPVSFIKFHGDWDYILWFDGGVVLGQPGVDAEMSAWSQRDGCQGAPQEVVYSHGEVECRASRGCAGGADVVLCRVAHGGHTWPGAAIAPGLGHTTADLDATESMLDFFLAHPRRPEPFVKHN